MGVALETVNPVVHDDPVYCGQHRNILNECTFLKYTGEENKSCWLFKERLSRGKYSTHKKCPQCKEHYAKNKDLEAQRLKSLLLNGEYFELKKPDGSREIIDPSRITLSKERRIDQ